MEKIQILGIARDPVVLQKLLRFINENPKWEGTGTIDDTSAEILAGKRKFDLVLFIDDITLDSERRLRASIKGSNPEVVFLKHYGDSTGLLAMEIQETIDSGLLKLKIDLQAEPSAKGS